MPPPNHAPFGAGPARAVFLDRDGVVIPDDGAARLSALRVPAEVVADQARLIAGYRSLRSEFDRALRPTLHGRTTDAFRVRAGRLASAPGFQVVARALQAIIAKGYDLGFPPGS